MGELRKRNRNQLDSDWSIKNFDYLFQIIFSHTITFRKI